MKLHTPVTQQCQHCEHEQTMTEGVEQCHKGACGRCTDGSQFKQYQEAV